MKKRLYMLLLLPMLDGCSVEILPERRVDDGYSDLTAAERAVLLRPSTASAENRSEYTAGPVFLERQSDDVRAEIQRYSFTWLMILASWCPHAQKDLLSLARHQSLLDSLGIHPIVLYRNYDLRYLSRKSAEFGLTLPIGFISAKVYGTNEEEKVKKLIAELAGGEAAYAGVPQHFLFDRETRLLQQCFGEIKDLRKFLEEKQCPRSPENDW